MIRSSLRFLSVALLTASSFAQVKVTVTTPTNNASTGAPVKVVASAISPKGMSSMAVFVDNTRVYFQWGDSITTYLWLAPGAHNLTVQGTDNTNQTGSSAVIKVNSLTANGTLTKIDESNPWESCTEANCAGGQGTSTTYTAPYQTLPSLDGSSRQFNIGGTGQYSNAYWYKFIGGSSTATNFTYDLWARVDNPTAPQALEFDVNQSFAGKRWVFGTQCNFKGSGKWDVWDGGKGKWVPTTAACKPWAANSWVHIVWSFTRVGDSVRYNTVTVNSLQFAVNLTLPRQASWGGSDIDVAVQLDGDGNQTPYNVWVDNVQLNVW